MAKEIIYVVGNAKNVGKTTVVRYLVRTLGNICVTSIGMDGEEVDSLTRHKKPSIEVFSGQYVISCDRFLDGARFEFLEAFDDNPIAGTLWFARALVDNKVILAGGSSKSLQYVYEKSYVDFLIVDGALDRLVHAGFMDRAKVILVIGATDFSPSETIAGTVERILNIFQIPLAPKWVIESFLHRKTLCLLQDDGSVKEFNESLLLKVELVKLRGWLFVPGILTEEVAKRHKNINFCLANPFAFLGNPSRFGNIYTVKQPLLLDVYVNFFARPSHMYKIVKLLEVYGYKARDLLALEREG